MKFLKKLFGIANEIVRCDHVKAGAHIEVMIKEDEHNLQLCQECYYHWERGKVRVTDDGKVKVIIV